jgi:hypothetical protein
MQSVVDHDPTVFCFVFLIDGLLCALGHCASSSPTMQHEQASSTPFPSRASHATHGISPLDQRSPAAPPPPRAQPCLLTNPRCEKNKRDTYPRPLQTMHGPANPPAACACLLCVRCSSHTMQKAYRTDTRETATHLARGLRMGRSINTCTHCSHSSP